MEGDVTNRHVRRRVLVLERKIARSSKSAPGGLCGWYGCNASFAGDMPRGWAFLFTYWSRKPRAKFLDIPEGNVVRDGVLCPAHVRALESHLKDLGRKIDQAMPAGKG